MQKRRLLLFLLSICIAVPIALLVFPGTIAESTKGQESAGVMLYGCAWSACASGGWLENTNPYPVRIHGIWQDRGEETRFLSLLGPGEKLSLDGICRQHGFYVPTLDGVLVGWLNGACRE